MFREMKLYGKDPTTVQRSKTTFDAPLHWKEPSLIFVCSWGDFFHRKLPLDWLVRAWNIIAQCPQHTFQILTKRASDINYCLPDDWGDGWSNVWLGVTVENKDNVWRLEALSEVKAAIRFMSYEPAIGPVDNVVTT
jgi:protein gp37